jgi:putative protease
MKNTDHSIGYNPELLSPAGTLKRMRYAFAYGANAVYAGQPRYSLRARNNDFNGENLEIGIKEAHAAGNLFFVASNILAHNRKVDTYIDDLEPVIAAKPDALIMADPGLIMMVRERWPDTVVHLSVQSNVVNYAAVKFWKNCGVSRVILSRELSLEEIAEIREQCPDMELEVFVHGALCIAYSGRCLLSSYINKRDPNQGTCTNACRWNYNVQEATEDAWGNLDSNHPGFKRTAQERLFTAAEMGQEDRGAMRMEEDEHGTYVFNSKDLRAVHLVEKLMQMRIDCFKIEGRTKSHFYAAKTAQVYRQAIDDAKAGRPFNRELMDELECLANRGYTEGFFRRHVFDEYQNYEHGSSKRDKQEFCGEIVDYDAQKGMATVNVNNKFALGDELEVITPQGNQRFELVAMESEKGLAMKVAPGSGHVVKITCPQKIVDEYGLLAKTLKTPILS